MVEFSAPYGVALVRHDNHTPAGTFGSARITAQRVTVLMIRNTDPTNSIQISFDGVNGFTLGPNEALSFRFKALTEYYTKALSGSPAVQVMLGSDS